MVRVVTAEDYTICRRVLDPFTISPVSEKEISRYTEPRSALVSLVLVRSLPVYVQLVARFHGISSLPESSKKIRLPPGSLSRGSSNCRREKGGVPRERKRRAVEDFRVNLRAKVDGPPGVAWPRTRDVYAKVNPGWMLDAAVETRRENAGRVGWGGCSLLGLRDDNNKRRSVPSRTHVFSLMLVSFSRDRCPSPFFSVSSRHSSLLRPFLRLFSSFCSRFCVRWCARALVPGGAFDLSLRLCI